MMKLVFVADQFELRAPAQQLLDRFLIGYPADGKFHKPRCEITLVIPQSSSEVERRVRDFDLQVKPDIVSGDGALLFSPSVSGPPAPRCFIHGAPSRSIPGIAGTAVRGAFLLPEISVPKHTRLSKGLAIVQGPFPTAEIEALDALLPLIWHRKSADPKVRNVTPLGTNDFWEILKRDFWPLLRSAISRSDTPQGDPVRDGRTQDIVGLGLLENLVKAPRGWLIDQHDGFVYVIAVLDGAIADYNVALQTASGAIISAQVHRPPAPGEHHYSRLAAMLERYFQTGVAPWPIEQNLLITELLERFRT